MLLTVPRPAQRVGELPELLRCQLLGSSPAKGRTGQESVEFVDRWSESPPRQPERVLDRLAPMLERGIDDGAKPRSVLDGKRGRPRFEQHDGGVHLGLWPEGGPGDPLDDPDPGPRVGVHGQAGVLRIPASCDEPPRELRLVHQRAEVEPLVQEAEGDGGRDLVRQVAHDLVESWKGDSQGVPTNHLQFAAEVAQSRGKPTVPFHRHDFRGALQEESGENPEPGSDLQDHIVGADAGELDVPVGDAGIDEEVLPQPLRRSHPEHAEALSDFLDVHGSTSLRRTIILGRTLIYGGRNRRPWTSPRPRPRCSARKVSRAGRSASSSASPSSRSSALSRTSGTSWAKSRRSTCATTAGTWSGRSATATTRRSGNGSCTGPARSARRTAASCASGASVPCDHTVTTIRTASEGWAGSPRRARTT